MKLSTTKRISSLAVGACMAAATTVAFTQPAAAEGDRFQCDPGFYQVIAGQLAELDPINETYSKIGEDLSNYNAMAYRIADGYLYGISGSTLHRIDANGVRTDVAQLDVPSGSYTGDFGDDGLLHISRGGRNWHKVNIDTLETTAVPEFDGYTAVADITNVHGVFFGVSSDGSLYSYDQDSLEAKEVGAVSGLPEELKAYGAAWSTAGGNLYVGRNSGEIYQITGYTTGSPTATQVGRAPSTSSNDGASCSLAVPIPGLNDVDGPEPESPPRTPEAEEASESYSENYDEVSATFAPVIVVEEEQTSEQPQTPQEETPADANQSNDQNFTFDDAAVGTGPGCETGEDVDRPERDASEEMVSVTTETELYNAGFTGQSLSSFKVLSGTWNAADGALVQSHDCGYDYSVLLREHRVVDFSWEASFSAIAESNQGGLIINQSSPTTRSGAMAIDLTDEGKTLRWGEYDERGYYQNIGSTPVTLSGANQQIKLSVEVHGQDVAISVDGAQVATAQSTHAGGMVGLTSSLAAISYEQARLVALPAVEGSNVKAEEATS